MKAKSAPPKNQCRCAHIAQRHAVAGGEPVIHRCRLHIEGNGVFRGQRFGQAHPHPYPQRAMPLIRSAMNIHCQLATKRMRLAYTGREDRRGHEEGHGDGDDLRHFPARDEIAHYRRGDDARAGRRCPLQGAGGQHPAEIGRGKAEQRRQRVGAQRGEQHGVPAQRIGQRAVGKLRDPEAQHIGGDDQLALIAQRIKGPADLRQGGQHDVDGQRVERHQRARHGDQLGHAQRGAFGIGRGKGHGGAKSFGANRALMHGTKWRRPRS